VFLCSWFYGPKKDASGKGVMIKLGKRILKIKPKYGHYLENSKIIAIKRFHMFRLC